MKNIYESYTFEELLEDLQDAIEARMAIIYHLRRDLNFPNGDPIKSICETIERIENEILRRMGEKNHE